MNRPRFSPPPPPQSPSRALSGWRARLGSDPIPRLLREGSPSVLARIRRDLIDDSEAPTTKDVWEYPEVKALVKKMDKEGMFPARPADKTFGSAAFADVLATLRAVDRLADLGAIDEGEAASGPLRKAVDFLLKSQNKEGGIEDFTISDTPKGKGKLPALHFQGWAISALCRTGFEKDPRVEQGMQFLIERRQDDGGWAWRGVRTDSPARPSSHMVTGMVLRAFASSSVRRTSREARRAGELLATRFLQPDRYPDRKEASHWENLAEPRFFSDVLDALDTVTAVGLGKENSGVRTAEAYLRSRQQPDGLWYPGPPPSRDKELFTTKAERAKEAKKKDKDDDKDIDSAIWLTLRVLVVLRRIN